MSYFNFRQPFGILEAKEEFSDNDLPVRMQDWNNEKRMSSSIKNLDKKLYEKIKRLQPAKIGNVQH